MRVCLEMIFKIACACRLFSTLIEQPPTYSFFFCLHQCSFSTCDVFTPPSHTHTQVVLVFLLLAAVVSDARVAVKQ